MLKYMTRLFAAVSLCFCLFSCSKDSDADKSADYSELKAFIASIQSFDEKETVVLRSKEIGAKKLSEYSVVENEVTNFYEVWEKTWHNYAFDAISTYPTTGAADVIWPGNFIQGNALASGELAPIPISPLRKPGRIMLPVVSGQAGMTYYRDVDTFSGSEVIQAMNDMLAKHVYGFPANITYIQQSVQSLDEMAYYLNMSDEDFKKQTNGVFGTVDWTQKKTRVMVKLEQVYYTMAYDMHDISDVFIDDCTPDKLSAYTGPGNPLCYISSVEYGRYFVLLYESDVVTTKQLEEAVNKAFNKDSDQLLSADDFYAFSNSKVYLRQIGGNPEDGLATITGNPQKIRDFILKGAKISKDNIGAPIHFEVKYLSNSRPVKTYKELDVNLVVEEKIKKLKKNDLTFVFKAVHSDALELTGGNLKYVSNASKLWAGPMVLTHYKNDGSVQQQHYYHTKANGVSAQYRSDFYDYYKIGFGELGVNPEDKIRLSFGIQYYGKRHSGSGGSTRDDLINIPIDVIFEFDTRTEKWVIINSSPGIYADMKSLSVPVTFGYFKTRFSLNYEISANGETY